MAKRKGQVVSNTLVTPDTLCKWPIVDINDVGGGRLIVDSIADRNNIPEKFLKAGMVVYVAGTVNKDYKLKAGYSIPTVDNNWEPYYTEIPPGVLTQHQKVEDIQYNNPSTVGGYSTLLAKLDSIDTKLASCLTSHQFVEDIQYKNPSDPDAGFNTLSAKLKKMNNDIATAMSKSVYIEDISYKIVPSTPDTHNHKVTLADELETLYTNMNDPLKIMIDDNGTTPTNKLNLQAMINKINRIPKVEEITNASGIALDVLLNDASNINNIKYQTVPTTITLKQKIDAIDTMVSGIRIESLNWGTVPTSTRGIIRNSALSTELNTLFSIINDPTQIKVAPGESLATRLANIASGTGSGAAAAPTIEAINWASTPSDGHSHSAGLAAELETLFGNVDTNTNDITSINATIADMNDETKINVTMAGGVTDLKSAIQLLENNIAAASVLPKVEDIEWNVTPTGTGRSKDLSAELNTIFSKITDMNDPTKINVNMSSTTVDLQTAINNINTTLGTCLTSMPKVEDIKWNVAPTGAGRDASLDTEINNLFTNMNDPSQIMITRATSAFTGSSAVGNMNLLDLLDEVTNDIVFSAKIENIVWGIVPADSHSHGATLADELENIYNVLTNPTNIVINPSTGFTLGSALANLRNATDITVTKNGGVTENLNTCVQGFETDIDSLKDGSGITVQKNGGATENLNTCIQGFETSLNTLYPIVTNPTWNATTPATTPGLVEEIAMLKTQIANMQMGTQYLMFNMSDLEVGPFKAQEFLTNFKAKIDEIAIYTNSDANLDTTGISIQLETCNSGSTSYTLLAGTTLTVNSSNSGLFNNVDLSASGIVLNKDTRIRVNVTGIGTVTVDQFSIRVTLKETV